MDFEDYYRNLVLKIEDCILKEDKDFILDKIEESNQINELYQHIFQNSSSIDKELKLGLIDFCSISSYLENKKILLKRDKSLNLDKIMHHLIIYEKFSRPNVSIDIQKMLLRYEFLMADQISNDFCLKYDFLNTYSCICYYYYVSRLCSCRRSLGDFDADEFLFAGI